MRKSDKKLDNELRKSLTHLCENDLEQIEGFQWLTHTASYPNIQATLRIICVFDTNTHLEQFLSTGAKNAIESKIDNVLSKLGVKLKKLDKHLAFDSEENCTRFHGGNWAKRLQK